MAAERQVIAQGLNQRIDMLDKITDMPACDAKSAWVDASLAESGATSVPIGSTPENSGSPDSAAQGVEGK